MSRRDKTPVEKGKLIIFSPGGTLQFARLSTMNAAIELGRYCSLHILYHPCRDSLSLNCAITKIRSLAGQAHLKQNNS